MPQIGVPEIVLILVVALLIFGPGKLPEIGGALGQGIREFKDSISGVREELDASQKALEESLNPATAKNATKEDSAESEAKG